MTTDLDGFLAVLKLLHRFRAVERALRIPGAERYENDAEHSYELAMMTWYLITHNDLFLNLERALKYALIHDLVEAYSGDVDVWDTEGRKLKKEREAQALSDFILEFPDLKEWQTAIRSYEGQIDAESRFVWALDKLLPVTSIYFDGGRAWRERGISFEQLYNEKFPKISTVPELKSLFLALHARLENQQLSLFPQTK